LEEKTVNKISRLFSLIVLISLLGVSLAACGGSPETVTISGAFALYPMMNRWAEEYQKINPKITFDISAGGAGKGMTDALAGAVEIGMVSRAISPEEEAKGAFWIPVTKDAVFATVNAANPVLEDLKAKGITKEALIDIFITGNIKTWGQLVGRPEITDEIHVYNRSDACGAGETWAKYLGNKKQEDIIGVAVYGDPGELDAVAKDALGIGYNNLNYAFDMDTGKPVAGTFAAPIDVNGDGIAQPEELLETKAEAVQMVAEGKYPSPPARDLNLVTKGKPTGATLAFINWVLTDGQKFVGEAGYVQLTQQQLAEAIQKLK
jgi:phosphate transport system substrate-binding protein